MCIRVKACMLLAVFTLSALVLASDSENDSVTREALEAAETIIGLTFTPEERDSMIDEVSDNLESYRKLRTVAVDNGVPPALDFNPRRG